MAKLQLEIDGSALGIEKGDLDDPSSRVRLAIQGLVALEANYGKAYNSVDESLRWARENRPEDTDLIKSLEEARKNTVLGFKGANQRLKTTINEAVPGAFPPGTDVPTESLDVPCSAFLAAAATMAAACARGVVPACYGAAILLGIAAAAESSGACA